MSNSDEIIGRASPHTIKKFELIEKYVETWAQKLLQNEYCSGLVFIDCMSNGGEYVDDNNHQVFGTPVRVAKYLRNVAGQYPRKQIDLFFSDLSTKKQITFLLLCRKKNIISIITLSQRMEMSYYGGWDKRY